MFPTKSSSKVINDPNKMWRRKRIQVEMIIDRGYLPDIEETENINDINLFTQNYTTKNKSTFLSNKYRSVTDKKSIYIIYNIMLGKRQSDITQIVKIIDKDSKEDALLGIESRYIVISHKPISQVVEQKLSNLTFHIELFTLDFFAFNPARHVLTQKHNFLTRDAQTEFFISSGISSNELGSISIDDPIVKYYGYQQNIGGIVQIIRDIRIPSHIDKMYYYRQIRQVTVIEIPDAQEVLEAEEGPDVTSVPEDVDVEEVPEL